MKPLLLLDFDGVLFNSAYEAYQVCEHFASKHPEYRRSVDFEEFMGFRSYLTDAWQFCRLYQKNRLLDDVQKLYIVKPDEHDWEFSKRFFEARAEMMKDDDWAKLMSPYPFFYQLRPLLKQYSDSFKILSTRNVASIQKTLDFFEADGIEIYGQEHIREHGSKLGVAKHNKWLSNGCYVFYIDDMNSHLEPFKNEVDLCIHVNWGYDVSTSNSYTQEQAFHLIQGFLRIAYE